MLGGGSWVHLGERWGMLEGVNSLGILFDQMALSPVYKTQQGRQVEDRADRWRPDGSQRVSQPG